MIPVLEVEHNFTFQVTFSIISFYALVVFVILSSIKLFRDE